MNPDLFALSAVVAGIALGVLIDAAVSWDQRVAARAMAEEQCRLDAAWRLRRDAYDREHGDHSLCTPTKRRGCPPMPPAPPRLTVGG